jgi:hemolysin activation/secretion protein
MAIVTTVKTRQNHRKRTENVGLGTLLVFCLFAPSWVYADESNAWVQFPPRVTPREPIVSPTNGKSELIQFPPVKALSMGKKSESKYKGGTQSYTVTFADGTTTNVTEKAVSEGVTWASDHVTKTITYKFADGSTHSESEKTQGVIRKPQYQGNQQIIVVEYGDGTVSKSVDKAVDQRRAWTDDHTARIDTYTFADGNIHQDIEPVALLKKTAKYEGSTQEVTYSYSDGSSQVKKFQAVTQFESWSADHETKTIKYSFQDGSSSKKVERIEPRLLAVRYAGDKKITSIRYGDGYIKDLTQQATSKEVTWSDDKRTKQIKYKFADGSTHSDEVRVDATLVKAEYDNDVEINTFKFGDGTFETKKEKATSKTEEWERDHVTKRTHFKFASGKTNTLKTVEKPISSIVSYERNLQYVNVRFPDGTVDSIVNKAISESVTWRDDHITRATHYKFKDGTGATTFDTVLPKRQSPTYLRDEQTILTQFADGYVDKQVNKAIGHKESWSPEKTQRKVTYQFADGSGHVDEQFVGVSGTLLSKDLASKAAPKSKDQFAIRAFEFKGNTRLESGELGELLDAWVGKDVDLDSLKNAATLITNVYREKGMLVKVEIPQQEVVDGVVVLNISEAKLASVALRNQLLDNAVSKHAQKIVQSHNALGDFVDLKKLDKSAILLSEIPGVQADLTLKPGRNPNETDAIIDVENTKSIEGSLSVDNSGARSTGNRRMLGSINFNGLAQRGEQLGIQAMHSQGADYARIAHSEPIGPYGWRIGVTASEMKYQVISSNMLALNARGPASTRGVEMMVPIVRGRDGNLSLQITADDKKFRNETYAGTYSRYSANVYGFNLQGTQSDEIGRGGLTTYGLNWTNGRFDLNGSPNEYDDLNGAHIAGKFNKYKLSFKREQQLNRSTTLSLSYQSQWADKNLDSSEKIFLGGAQGVRAYGANEAGGTQGQLLNLELQHQTQLDDGVFTQAVFYDAGEITVNKNNNFATALPLNSYSLKGAGFWAGWNVRNKLGMAYARLTWARRIGVNPAANLMGLDQDGTYIRDRWWLTLNQSF